MKNKILWKLQQDFKDYLETCVRRAKYGDITIKELLDLGFNNNYLKIGNKTFGLGWKNLDNEYSRVLSQEQMNTKIVLSYCGEDGDGYICSVVKLKNEEDSELFDNLKEKDICLEWCEDYE